MRLALVLAAALLWSGGLLAQEIEDLPEGPGREDAYYLCSACHSFMLVAQQGLSRERWDDVLGWMVEEQGMDPPEPPTREAILDYLSEHYGPDRPNWRR
jgi:cytochrome c